VLGPGSASYSDCLPYKLSFHLFTERGAAAGECSANSSPTLQKFNPFSGNNKPYENKCGYLVRFAAVATLFMIVGKLPLLI
jgi:hypothetical protein